MNIILLFSVGILFGMIVTWLFELVLKSNKWLRNRYYRHHKIIFGYHVHHSMYGLIAIVVSIILFLIKQEESAIFYLAIGIGIVIVHTISDGRFVFFEKQK